MQHGINGQTQEEHQYTADHIAGRLEKAKKTTIRGVSGWIACCPAHSDKTPSLTLWHDEEGRLAFKCHAGCSHDEVRDALGIPSDYYKRKKQKSPSVQYVYRDELGNAILTKTRFQDESGKRFTIKATGTKPAAELGAWYARQCISKSKEEGKPIYICEGEKAVGAALNRGLLATCPAVGKSDKQWAEDSISAFRGTNCRIICDRDKAGEEFSVKAYQALKRVAASVGIYRSPLDLEKADLYDHLMEGLGEEDLVRYASMEPKLGLQIVNASSVDTSFKRQFVIEPYLPKGLMVLIDGDGGTGKTTIALSLAAMITTGKALMLPSPMREMEPQNVLYIGDEDEASDYVRIFETMGGDKSRLNVYQDVGFALSPKGLSDLKETILDTKSTLVILDALLYYILPVIGEANVNNNSAYRPILASLASIYRDTNSCGLHIRHTNKAGVGMGPVQLRNSHRGQYRIRRMDQGITGIIDEKGSISIPKALGWGFERKAGGAQYTSQFDHEFIEDDENKIARVNPNQIEEIKHFLREQLPRNKKVWYPELVAGARGYGMIIGGPAVTLLHEQKVIGHERVDSRNYIWIK